MADFSQLGAITSLHRLVQNSVSLLSEQLSMWSASRPITVVIPCHADDLEAPALETILKTLAAARFVRRIILGLDAASVDVWRRTFERLQGLSVECAVLWNESPAVAEFFGKLGAGGVAAVPRGKGRNLWLCIGLALALEAKGLLLVHDADILTYSEELPARLCWPVAHPELGFAFCKGFAARFSQRLNGRVMRLLVTPLLRALETLIGGHPLLRYLGAFRYPLAGEFACRSELAARLRVAADWGAEISLLAEVRNNTVPEAVCQAEFAERYDHKHQELSAEDASRGLHKMAVDVARRIFLSLAGEGVAWDEGAFDELVRLYLKEAALTLRAYRADAGFNALDYELEAEELAVSTFAHSLSLASAGSLGAPSGEGLLPCWKDVFADWPEAGQLLLSEPVLRTER